MSRAALEAIRHAAVWFEPTTDGLDPLLESIGDARLVLIGEASHGTHEFYQIRAELTKALIARKGFNVVAVEADWPERTASIAGCGMRVPIPMPKPRWAISRAFRDGCGATGTWWSS